MRSLGILMVFIKPREVLVERMSSDELAHETPVDIFATMDGGQDEGRSDKLMDRAESALGSLGDCFPILPYRVEPEQHGPWRTGMSKQQTEPPFGARRSPRSTGRGPPRPRGHVGETPRRPMSRRTRAYARPLRTIYRKRPGRTLHIGRVRPIGFGWSVGKAEIRMMPVGRPSKTGAMKRLGSLTAPTTRRISAGAAVAPSGSQTVGEYEAASSLTHAR